MAQFSYEAVGLDGIMKKGNIESDSLEKARSLLRNDGLTVVKIGEASVLNRDININIGTKKLKPRESALAGILNCRFGGPHVYFGEIVYKPFIGDKDRFIHTQDMHKAVDINRRAEILMVIVNIVCLYLVG